MTEAEIGDLVKDKYPFVFRNNRGCMKTPGGGFIRFGIPEPRVGEKADDHKGGDYIGFAPNKNKIPVFISIEIKTINDKIKTGQIKWHNFLLDHGCLSEIWDEFEPGKIKITRTKIKV